MLGHAPKIMPEPPFPSGDCSSMLSSSAAMQFVFDMIGRVAPTSVSVLIEGESGTGKELVAHAIHSMGSRRHAVLLPVNCGAIPEALIESELFGHERGSFTGADRRHQGVFERASGGTLFLDEITEMPLRLQVKLLRVLETGLVQRVGGNSAIETDVRVIAATNRNPIEAIRSGLLREDLYFRLAAFTVALPSLRDRRGDVPLLARHFLDELNLAHGTIKVWAEGALNELDKREWRGNVRELKNAVLRAFIMADDVVGVQPSMPQAIPQAMQQNGASRASCSPSLPIDLGCSLQSATRVLVEATLRHLSGDKPAAAALLGISLRTLCARLKEYASSGSAEGAGLHAAMPA